MYLACSQCGQPLTEACRLGEPSEWRMPQADRASPVPPGIIVCLAEEQATDVFQGDAVLGRHVYSPAGAYSVNPDDVIADAIVSSGPDNGCCGSAGCDGPNRSCSRCGAVLGTEWSDCWTQAEIRFNPEAVVIEGVPRNSV